MGEEERFFFVWEELGAGYYTRKKEGVKKGGGGGKGCNPGRRRKYEMFITRRGREEKFFSVIDEREAIQI